MGRSRKRKARPAEVAEPNPEQPPPLPVLLEEQVDHEEIHPSPHQAPPQQQQPPPPKEDPDYAEPEEEDPEAEDGEADDSSDDDDEEEEEEEEEEEDEEEVEEEEEEEDEEDIGKLLEVLPKQQLVSLLRSAASSDPRILAEIRRVVGQDRAYRNVFVRGLTYGATVDTLRSVFSQYGDIEECAVVTDHATGKSKGYGFVLFRRRSAALRAIREPEKVIDGRVTACQLADLGRATAAALSHHTPDDVHSRRIFVGNVRADTPTERLLEFFSQYGEIEEGPLGFDRATGRPKGYALFVYKTVEGARRVLQDPNKNFYGQFLYCKRAADRKIGKVAAGTGATATTSSVAPDVQGNMGNNATPGGTMASGGPMELGLAQGFGAAMPFAAQGMQANAAPPMMPAAGQNPAAMMSVPPAMMLKQQVPPVQGYGMGGNAGYHNFGYQGPPVQHSGGFYQGAPMANAPAMGHMGWPMGGY